MPIFADKPTNTVRRNIINDASCTHTIRISRALMVWYIEEAKRLNMTLSALMHYAFEKYKCERTGDPMHSSVADILALQPVPQQEVTATKAKYPTPPKVKKVTKKYE